MLCRLLFAVLALGVLALPAELGAQTAPARRGITLTVAVTTGTGTPIQGARVILTGPVNRDGETIPNGTIRFLGLRTGSYRVRVEHVGYVTLERDLSVRATQAEPVEMTLSEAPAPPPAPEPPEAAAPPPAADAPPGDPRSFVIADFVEKNFISSREPRKEDELGCTASARTRLIQLRESTKEQSTADADEVLYVVAGEGTLRLGNSDVALRSSTLAVVPRGTVRALTRKGRTPLIVLSIVSGPSCTAPTTTAATP